MFRHLQSVTVGVPPSPSVTVTMTPLWRRMRRRIKGIETLKNKECNLIPLEVLSNYEMCFSFYPEGYKQGDYSFYYFTYS